MAFAFGAAVCFGLAAILFIAQALQGRSASWNAVAGFAVCALLWTVVALRWRRHAS
ncbi:MAG TPA: hypothetical protein VFN37_01255 [Candidatus Baltobacteraceae bacterium]|nr:hypothetical protein [Candidatus Baltobacteraceae bacterium]